MDSIKVHAGTMWGLLVAAIATLGTIKTVLVIASGEELTLGKVAFMIGMAAFFVYLAAFTAFVIWVVLAGAAMLTIGEDNVSEGYLLSAMIIGGTASLIFWGWGLISVVQEGEGLAYEDLDGFGKAFSALGGLAVVGLAIFMWRKYSGEEKAKTT